MARTKKAAKKAARKTSKKTSKQTDRKATKQTAGSASALTLRLPPHIQEALFASLRAANALDDDSPSTIAYNLLSALQTAVNAQIPIVFTTQPVNIFGDPNNVLDPLNFNGALAAQTSGTVCLPQTCTNIWPFGETCVPPDWMACASASASASVDSLSGLSTLQIKSFNYSTPTVNGNSASLTGSMTISGQTLSANGSANASGGVAGFSIPISTSASITLSTYTVELTITVSFNLAPPQLTTVTINSLNLNLSGFSINIGSLGPFGSLFDPLFNAFTGALINALGNVATNGLQGVLQNIINSQL
ncbi:MAG TPA: hypothetical protein VFA21_01735 [Pyrinomonadaceae bacterium]|nr:hypothetical protein [Pyrinomonadaceae bacterium]